MKKILFIAVGLMSLLGLSSCDDKSTFIETEEFAPYCFVVKDESTIQVVGYKSLIIEEMQKTDWQLYVQFSLPFTGDEPLKLKENEIDLLEYNDKKSIQLDVETNLMFGDYTENLSFAVSGLLQPYTYMGEEVQLMCMSQLKVKIDVEVESITEDPAEPFHEKGMVVISLVANKDEICLAQKSVPFEVSSMGYYRELSNK